MSGWGIMGREEEREGSFRGSSVRAALQSLHAAWGEDALVIDVEREGPQYVVRAARGAANRVAPAVSGASTWALREAGFSASFARTIVADHGEDLQGRALQEAVESRIRVHARRGCGPAGSARGRRLLVFTGPTGVGKTTTLAKLAGRLARETGVQPALITLDTFRVGAVDQLRAYADVMRLPFAVLQEGGDLKSLLERFDSRQVVMIDTAGRSQNDLRRLSELRGSLEGARALEVFLCLSATTMPHVALEILERFRCLGPKAAILTKIDENPTFGHLLEASLAAELPIAYTTNGQEVPRDLQVATAPDLARRVLARGTEVGRGLEVLA